jgi:hypothetical protein
MPGFFEFGLLVAMGVFGGLGQMLMKHAETNVVMLFDYWHFSVRRRLSIYGLAAR